MNKYNKYYMSNIKNIYIIIRKSVVDGVVGQSECFDTQALVIMWVILIQDWIISFPDPVSPF